MVTSRPWYFDSSAALKLIMKEAESDALSRLLDRHNPECISSFLLETELRRAIQRSSGLSQSLVTELLTLVEVVTVPSQVFGDAGLLPGKSLRSLDALHLASAIFVGASTMVCYDIRLARAAVAHGFTVVAPAP